MRKDCTTGRPASEIQIGEVFGQRTVIGEARRRGTKRYLTVRCSCGSVDEVSGPWLLKGKGLACRACTAKRGLRATHRGYGTPEYKVWVAMRQRCSNPSTGHFADYGGRGIKVCARWDSFGNFLADMGKRPSADHSIDRINNDGDYEPGNCRWVLGPTQAANRRPPSNAVFLTFEGETKRAAEWAEALGVTKEAIYRRIKLGWPDDQVLSTPFRKAKA
jgi:hypothetical protein